MLILFPNGYLSLARKEVMLSAAFASRQIRTRRIHGHGKKIAMQMAMKGDGNLECLYVDNRIILYL